MDSNFRFPDRKRRFPLRKGETGDGEHKRRLEPRPQRIRRFGYLGNRNLELPRRSLPPKVGHFSLSEAGRVVGAASAGAPGRRLVNAQALSIDYGAVDRVEALIEPENDASRALAANRPVTPMTRNSQRPAFVLVADLPQKSGPYTEPPPVARPWAVFVFDRSSPHSRFASKSREPS